MRCCTETLRIYPPGTRLERRCTKDYKLPGTDVVVEKGIIVSAAVKAIHMDPQYYPDPEKFDPERFNPEEKAKRNPYTYMPFGHGPRNCNFLKFKFPSNLLVEIDDCCQFYRYWYEICFDGSKNCTCVFNLQLFH